MDSMKFIQISPSIDLEVVRKFCDEILVPFEKLDPDSQEFLLEVPREMHARGILQIAIPKEFGGAGAPVTDLVWVVREMASVSPSATFTFIGNLLGLSAVLLYGSDPLRKRLSQEHLKNFALWSFAMTEGGVGSDLANITTRARKVPGGYVLSGEKNYITNATHSSHLAIFARLVDENDREQGISCFYVPYPTENFERGPALRKIGMKRANTGTLIFRNAFLPEEALLGEPGQGLRILTHCLNRSKTLLGAVSVGIASRALHLGIERLSQTERFGKTLLSQPAIRHQLAKLATKVETAWLLVCQAATCWDAGIGAVKQASMAKMVGGATAVETCSVVMELFGARGYLQDFEISRLMSDAKAIEIVEGPTLVQELLIAKEFLANHPAACKEDEKKKHKPDAFKLQSSDLKKKVA